MKALVDVTKTIHGWDVVAWKVGERKWVKRNGSITDHFIADTFKPGFTLWGGAISRLVPCGKVGYWRNGNSVGSADFVRVELAYPLHERLKDHDARCQAKWNDRTNTFTGCERQAIGRFVVTGSDLKRRRIRLCASCSSNAR